MSLFAPATVLHDQLSRAGINVVGVSIGRKDDKRTWRIDLADESQRAQADALVAAFDPATKPPEPTRREKLERATGLTIAEIKAELAR